MAGLFDRYKYIKISNDARKECEIVTLLDDSDEDDDQKDMIT